MSKTWGKFVWNYSTKKWSTQVRQLQCKYFHSLFLILQFSSSYGGPKTRRKVTRSPVQIIGKLQSSRSQLQTQQSTDLSNYCQDPHTPKERSLASTKAHRKWDTFIGAGCRRENTVPGWGIPKSWRSSRWNASMVRIIGRCAPQKSLNRLCWIGKPMRVQYDLFLIGLSSPSFVTRSLYKPKLLRMCRSFLVTCLHLGESSPCAHPSTLFACSTRLIRLLMRWSGGLAFIRWRQ